MTTLKELSDQLGYLSSIGIIIWAFLTFLAKLVVKLRPIFKFVNIAASLIVPYGFVAWIFVYKAVEISDYLRENSSVFFLLVAQLAGFSTAYALIWGWCAWRLYPKLRARSENQKQNTQPSPYYDERDIKS